MKVLPRNTILPGDAREVLAELLPESVDSVITSPPYFGLRDYGAPGQLGTEATVDEYVRNLRGVIRLLRRVLKPSGSLWLNLGDSYARSSRRGVPVGSLALVPQRLALALVAEDFTVRNVCAWVKPNPLPQSAQDRLSPTYEVVLFAAKSRRYYFDLDAIRVPHRSAGRIGRRSTASLYQGGNSGLVALKAAGRVGNAHGKNPGDVFTVATANDRFGHQATFPEALIEPLLLASTPEKICEQCDQPWRRPTRILTLHTAKGSRSVRKVGQLVRCDCFAPTRPGVVLDPFAGLNTVGLVAERHRRDWLAVELNPRYRALAMQRLARATEAA